MKPVLTMILLSAGAALPALAAEPAPGRPQMRDVVTQLEVVDGEEAARPNPLQRLKPVAKAPVLKKREPVSILKRSDFLSATGLTAVVPKGSILHVPPRLQQRLKLVPGNRVVVWQEFFRRNRNWVTTVEMTRAQAEGRQEIPEQTLKTVNENERVVVATLRGGPISVLPPQEPATEEPDPEVATTTNSLQR